MNFSRWTSQVGVGFRDPVLHRKIPSRVYLDETNNYDLMIWIIQFRGCSGHFNRISSIFEMSRTIADLQVFRFIYLFHRCFRLGL